MATETAVNAQITDSTAVNEQITDSVSQANAKVLADSPALAMGTLFQTMAHATGLAYQNAVAAQQQLNTLAQAATTQGVALLYSIDTASAGATK
ncbi:RebB family R body protein [Nannocystis bainbridge]|uniref:RebB family R body protein n=1 Tax=Nannocystis bainbridge TaxID=2995303 RepID=A0ABT5E9B6_9BACT|nr:RebB family R body protein [Nannocystis bainbridge]MDC0722453.1 RebB family R body protein [Nannocystis bainbridge]